MMKNKIEAAKDELVVEVGEADSAEILSLVDDLYDYDLTAKFGGVCFQHRAGVPNPWRWVDGIGDLSIYSSFYNVEPNKLDVSPNDFNVLNEYFHSTVIEEIIATYNLTRCRVLWKTPLTSYPVHSDLSKTLHIPLITDPHNYFYFPDHDAGFHLELNKVYIVDTSENHLFVNAGKVKRLHLNATVADSICATKDKNGLIIPDEIYR